MNANEKIIYAFRGWIAFVAFMDFGSAMRSFIEKRSFLNNFVETDYNDEEYTTARIFGMFSILKAIVLIYATLYIHHKPVVDLGKLALLLSVVLYFNETIYFRTTTINVHVMFPCLLNVFTLCGLFYLPHKYKLWAMSTDGDNENMQLLKQANLGRRRANKKHL